MHFLSLQQPDRYHKLYPGAENINLYSADNKLIFFLFFPENRIRHFMQIVFNGENLQEMSKPVFLAKYFSMLSASNFTGKGQIRCILIIYTEAHIVRVVQKKRRTDGQKDYIFVKNHFSASKFFHAHVQNVCYNYVNKKKQNKKKKQAQYIVIPELFVYELQREIIQKNIDPWTLFS